ACSGDTARAAPRGRCVMTRSIFAALVAATLVILSCGGGVAPAPASSAPTAAATATARPAPVAMKVAYGNITNDNLGQWYAKEKGIFAENGLDVTLVSIDGGSRTMAALIANEVVIAQLGGSEVMSAQARGGDPL